MHFVKLLVCFLCHLVCLVCLVLFLDNLLNIKGKAGFLILFFLFGYLCICVNNWSYIVTYRDRLNSGFVFGNLLKDKDITYFP